ncbi:MAG: hypothetical protein ACJA1R_001271, partial [Flavobacteriales bacterium]
MSGAPSNNGARSRCRPLSTACFVSLDAAKMTSASDMTPGSSPSYGTIKVEQVLSSGRGANAGLCLHPKGRRLVSGWCGVDSAIELWGIDQSQHLERRHVEAGLSDVGAQLEDALLPVGSDKNREGWPTHILPVADLKMS